MIDRVCFVAADGSHRSVSPPNLLAHLRNEGRLDADRITVLHTLGLYFGGWNVSFD